MNLPSKELLSAVFGVTVTKTVTIDDNILYCEWNYLSNDTNGTDINLYELAHKCKEWAKENGYNISSGYADMDYDGDTCVASYSCYSAINLRCGHHSYNSKFDKDDWVLDYAFDGETEQEAIFKACQWILDDKEQK